MTPATHSPESSLLLTLEEISQLLSHSHDPHETLANIVRLIQGRFHTDVCSVYLLEPQQSELVLGATVGLHPQSVGRVRMRLSEGLTGLVAERRAPVMVGDAFEHPRFKYFPEAGEDPYHSFLGVPLIEGGALQGVLVVQTVEPRTFSPNEIRMLVTVGSQLASLVSGARLLEQVIAVAHESPGALASPAAPAVLVGVPLSPGSGVGRAYLVNGFQSTVGVSASGADRETERQRLLQAMEAAREEITRLSQRISELVGEGHGAILQAQLMLLQDRVLEQDLLGALQPGTSAESALVQTLQQYVAAFQKVTSPFFRERLYDIKDVFRRLLWHLRPEARGDEVGGERLVLVAHEASVMDLFAVDRDRLAAVVVEHGGPQSHAAILARSLGVPMVSQIAEAVQRIAPGQIVLVQGGSGTVTLEPTPEQLSQSIRTVPASGRKISCPPQDLPAGLPRVAANVNLLYEARQAAARHAAGIGLYRSEFLFLARRTLPTEDEQVGVYRKLLQAVPTGPVTIRTFDLRPDKLTGYSRWTAAAAHPYDWRQVLDSPPMQQLFKEQVRAVLRAAAAGPMQLLVPLITVSEQLDFVRQTLEQVRTELAREGLPHCPKVPVGIMLEVAAAAVMACSWADQVDFFALGTNDLFASALGIDRDNPCGVHQQDPLHPGMLRLLHELVQTAHAHGRPVSVCGEMAADPAGAKVLAAFGVDVLSVAVHQLEAVRANLAACAPEPLKALVPQLLSCRTAAAARSIL